MTYTDKASSELETRMALHTQRMALRLLMDSKLNSLKCMYKPAAIGSSWKISATCIGYSSRTSSELKKHDAEKVKARKAKQKERKKGKAKQTVVALLRKQFINTKAQMIPAPFAWRHMRDFKWSIASLATTSSTSNAGTVTFKIRSEEKLQSAQTAAAQEL